VDRDEFLDGLLRFSRAAVDAAAWLAFGEERKPSLDEIEPRGTRRCEMKVGNADVERTSA
jgi:hypothetical protein